MSRKIFTIVYSLIIIVFAPSVLAKPYWSDTKESVKLGSGNLVHSSKIMWNDSKKISIDMWADTKNFTLDLWDKTKQSLHNGATPTKSNNN